MEKQKIKETTQNSESIKGYLLIILAASFWGTLGVFGKELTRIGFHSFEIAFVRAFGALVLLSIISIIKDPKIFKIKFKDIKYFIGTGVLSFVLMNSCYFIAINATSLSVAAILLYTAPAMVMLMSILLFNEKITKKKILSLVLTFIGCVLVVDLFNVNTTITMRGVLFGLGAGLGYALYTIFGRYALKKYKTMTVTLYTFLFASIGLLPLVDVQTIAGYYTIGEAYLFSLLLMTIAAIIPYLLYTKGLSEITPSKASITATFEPVVASFLGIIIYNESLNLNKIIGMIFVIGAIYILKTPKDQLIEKS
jgi:drug/metabolite transporter (DMT)-like permease